MANMPMPNGLTLIVMVGSEAAKLAGNIKNSVLDHASSVSQHAIECFALVGDDFQKEQAVVEDVFYPCTPDNVRELAAQIAYQKIEEMVINMDQKGITQINRKRVNCVIVADANGSLPFDLVSDITDSISHQAIEALPAIPNCIICILTDHHCANSQHEWLMDNGKLRESINQYQKVLLLSTKDINGNIGARIEQSMGDAILPSLLLMLDGNEQDDPTKLYTAAYNKTGGTSNDILELKRHIAAEVLDGYFANPNRCTIADAWEFLSTQEIDLTNGSTTEQRLYSMAENIIPSVECIAATADLENKGFDAAELILSFDELNRDVMCEVDEFAKRWADEVLKKTYTCQYPDALLALLEDTGEISKQILPKWGELCKTIGALQDRNNIAKKLGYVDRKKRLLAKQQDHNLQLLSEMVSSYQSICKDRYVYRILNCLEQNLPLIRKQLQKFIDLRQSILNQYKQPDNKMAVLTDPQMCGNTASQLRSYYANNINLEQLPTYIRVSDKLNQADGANWRKLFRAFEALGTIEGNFTDAYMIGKVQTNLAGGIQQLALNAFALIPDLPNTFGALPLPSTYFLVNTKLADYLSSSGNFYGVPGDVIEYVALYRLSSDYSTLSGFHLFAPGSVIPGVGRGKVGALKQQFGGRIDTSNKVKDFNPWNIHTKQIPSGIQLSWDFADSGSVYEISVNDDVIEDHYDYKTFMANGMKFIIPSSYVHGNLMTITLRSGDEHQEVSLMLEQTQYELVLKPLNRKAKWGDCQLQRFTAECSGGVSGKYLVITQGSQQFRAKVEVCDDDTIGSLWLPEYDFGIALVDID